VSASASVLKVAALHGVAPQLWQGFASVAVVLVALAWVVAFTIAERH
jgi:hypothetical protein